MDCHYYFDLNLSEPEGAFNSADANLRYASSHKSQIGGAPGRS